MSVRKHVKSAAGHLLDFDETVHEFFDDYQGTRTVTALDSLSRLGDQPELRAMAGALIAAGVFGANDRLVRAGARMIVAHEAATLMKDAIKTEVDRTRPRSAAKRNEKKPRQGSHTAKEKTSFPSGHSAGAIAAARAFAREYPEYGVAALVAGGAIALSQVPRNAHYPTDVIAGAAIGLAMEALVDFGWKAARMDERSAGRR